MPTPEEPLKIGVCLDKEETNTIEVEKKLISVCLDAEETSTIEVDKKLISVCLDAEEKKAVEEIKQTQAIEEYVEKKEEKTIEEQHTLVCLDNEE